MQLQQQHYRWGWRWKYCDSLSSFPINISNNQSRSNNYSNCNFDDDDNKTNTTATTTLPKRMEVEVSWRPRILMCCWGRRWATSNVLLMTTTRLDAWEWRSRWALGSIGRRSRWLWPRGESKISHVVGAITVDNTTINWSTSLETEQLLLQLY